MKIAVITRHSPSNYGSLLQTIALSVAIEKLGHSCEIIDYIRYDEHYKRKEKTMLSGKPGWNGNPVKKAAYLTVRCPESIIAGRKFESDRKKYLHLSGRYENDTQLSTKKPSADVYMTGSDQVWNKTANGRHDSNYALSFTTDADRRVSYAASFGSAKLSEEEKQSYKKWLSRYDFLSVREENAVQILSELGLTARQVLDPTLLLDAKEWDEYCEKISAGKYVLVYQIHNDKKIGKYAKDVARSKGLPLLRVSPSLHQISREGRLVLLPSIGRFLSYIKNADCLITDSFHGTAFAINFNVPFVEVLPNSGTENRNLSLLKLAGLTDRVLTNTEDISLASRPIDFAYTNKVIEEKRAESLDILKKMIEG